MMASETSSQLMMLKQVQEKCPAFAEGCPYASITSYENLKQTTVKCPQFNSGCPFSSAQQMNLLNDLLAAIPPSHVTNDGAVSHSVATAFEQVHKISTKLKEEVGQCPVFASECIFKAKCLNLQPLIKELDLHTWGLIIKEMGKRVDSGDSIHLARELKTGTQDAHRAAEGVQFVRLFLRGKIPKEVYGKFVGCLYFIYQAIEEEARRNSDHEIFKHIHFPLELEREESLVRDLTYYFGENWREVIAPFRDLPCLKEYVDRVHYIGQKQPDLLVAHTYTRYLGDLSGGQVLKKVAVRTYKLPVTGEGTAFYDFDELPSKADHKKFKNNYRDILDSLEGVDKEKATAIVTEANIAFGLNTKLFQYLDHVMGFDTPILEVPRPTPDKSNAAQCPFATMGSKLPNLHTHVNPHTAATKTEEAKQSSLTYKTHMILKPFYPAIPRIFGLFFIILLAVVCKRLF